MAYSFQSKFGVRADQFRDFTAVETPLQTFDKLTRACGDFMICINELCDSWMGNALAKIRTEHENIFQKEVKRELNLAKNDLQRNISYAKSKLPNCNHNFYYEYVDAYTSRIDNDVKVLYFAIRTALRNANYDDKTSDLVTQLQIVAILLDTAKVSFRDLITDGSRHCHVNYNMSFEGYCPNKASFHWNRAFAKVVKMIDGQDIDMSRVPEVKTAYHNLLRKFINADFLDLAAYDSIQANYDELTEEDKKRFVKVKEVVNYD